MDRTQCDMSPIISSPAILPTKSIIKELTNTVLYLRILFKFGFTNSLIGELKRKNYNVKKMVQLKNTIYRYYQDSNTVLMH